MNLFSLLNIRYTQIFYWSESNIKILYEQKYLLLKNLILDNDIVHSVELNTLILHVSNNLF